MAFNLNRLVQPECGAPNPLVATAHQIAMRPSTSAMSRRMATNLTQEFIQQDPNQLIASSKSTSSQFASGQIKLGHNRSASSQFNSSQMNLYPQHLNIRQSLAQHHYPQMMAGICAGDQLEAKYRNDLTQNRVPSPIEKVRERETRHDDVEFWQSLAQRYVGPTTDSVSISELDYIFDERNPLKDQFEDPFAEGLKALEQGDIPSAALLFEDAVQRDPNNALAWQYLGTTQAQNEKDSSAIRALKRCLAMTPENREALLAISVSLTNENLQHEACKYLLEWLIGHDKYKVVGASMAQFNQMDSELSDDPFYMNSIHEKHYRYVRDKFVEAARMSPTDPDPEVQSSLGVIFSMRGEYEKAVDCFRAALSVRSEDNLLWNRLGATLANGNKSDEAVIAYRKALEISPGSIRSRYNLAISLIHLTIYDEAARQLVQILNMQAAGKGSKNTQIRTRSITSTSIWNTLRTVATLRNKPELYPIIDGRDLDSINKLLFDDVRPDPSIDSK